MEIEILSFDGKAITYIAKGSNAKLTAELTEVVKPEFVKVGKAKADIINGKVHFCKMSGSGTNSPKKTFGDDMVNFEQLLTAAHDKAEKDGCKLNIVTNVIKDESGKPLINLGKKYAVFKARVYLTKDGKEIARYEGHGDATEENITGDKIKIHFIRMAETRAIVRALRWYTNNACAEEEKD